MVPSMSTHLSFVTLGTPSLEVMLFVNPCREAKLSKIFCGAGPADCRERATDKASSPFSCALVLYVKTYYFQSSWFLARPLGDVSHRQSLTLQHTARPHRLLSKPLSSDCMVHGCLSSAVQKIDEFPTDAVLGQVDDKTTGAWCCAK